MGIIIRCRVREHIHCGLTHAQALHGQRAIVQRVGVAAVGSQHQGTVGTGVAAYVENLQHCALVKVFIVGQYIAGSK